MSSRLPSRKSRLTLRKRTINYQSMTDAIGPRLKFIREQRGLSQQALADAVDLTGSALSLIEAGKRTPSLKKLLALHKALGKPPWVQVFGR